MNISDEAVEAAATYLSERFFWNGSLVNEVARELLEAAAPILLSHERQLTADAHRDAIVNRDTVDRLERELGNAKADAWDEGWDAGSSDETDSYWGPCAVTTPNPYRSQA